MDEFRKIKRILDVDSDVKVALLDIAEEIENRIDEMKEMAKGEPGEKGKPGKDGKDYILTEIDKKAIASKIKVPIVEKVIERTEVIREQPITFTEVTNEIKEVAVADSGEEIVKKINSLETKPEYQIDAKHIKNLPATETSYWRGGGMTREAVLDLINSSTGTSMQRDNLTSQCDGSNIIFTLSMDYKPGTIQLWLSQFPIVFDPDTDFSETSANTITLNGIIPEAGQTLVCLYQTL